MALKKFSSFANQGKQTKIEEEKPAIQRNTKEELIPNLRPMKTSAAGINPPEFIEEKEPKIKKEDKKLEGPNENIKFIGKIAIIDGIESAKESFMLLENKNISKEKLWYFVFERKDELIFAKFNNKVGFKLKELTISLLNRYETKEPLLKSIIEKIEIDGKDDYVKLFNMTDKFKDLIKKDLIQLLSK